MEVAQTLEHRQISAGKRSRILTPTEHVVKGGVSQIIFERSPVYADGKRYFGWHHNVDTLFRTAKPASTARAYVSFPRYNRRIAYEPPPLQASFDAFPTNLMSNNLCCALAALEGSYHTFVLPPIKGHPLESHCSQHKDTSRRLHPIRDLTRRTRSENR